MGFFTRLTQIPKQQYDTEKWLQTKGTAILIVATLVVLAILAALASAVNQWATNTEKSWSFVSTASTILGGAVGLWFVWLKFIRTRDFAPKLDLTLTAGSVFLSSDEGNLHWCDVKLENKGTVAIDYQIEVVPLLYHAGRSIMGIPLASLVPKDSEMKSLVDVGATSYEHFLAPIGLEDAQAVTFQVKVWDGETYWWSHITASNLKPQPED